MVALTVTSSKINMLFWNLPRKQSKRPGRNIKIINASLMMILVHFFKPNFVMHQNAMQKHAKVNVLHISKRNTGLDVLSCF